MLAYIYLRRKNYQKLFELFFETADRVPICSIITKLKEMTRIVEFQNINVSGNARGD